MSKKGVKYGKTIRPSSYKSLIILNLLRIGATRRAKKMQDPKFKTLKPVSETRILFDKITTTVEDIPIDGFYLTQNEYTNSLNRKILFKAIE